MGFNRKVLHSSGQSGEKRAEILQMVRASQPTISFLCRAETVIKGEMYKLLKCCRQDSN
jgi:hypothetical protein